MDLQAESKLLSLPTEIRQAIYIHIVDSQVHTFLSQGRLQFSVCLQPNLGDDLHSGYERDDRNGERPNASWARRLQSSWGPHWKCEEVAYTQDVEMRRQSHNHISNLALVCKKMFNDVCSVVCETTVINVTDLESLDILLARHPAPGNSWKYWDYVLPDLHKLNITLRLSPAFYKSIEEEEASDPATINATRDISKEYLTWTRLWPAICQLPQLRSLYIWLDHDEPSSWSIVKERLVLHAVTSALAVHAQGVARGKTLPRFDTTFNLPKLHPAIAKSESHFKQECETLPFIIDRRFRQRHHCVPNASGGFTVKYEPDFPIMHELIDFYGEGVHTWQEVEDLETALWEKGRDVKRVLLEIDDRACFEQANI